MHEPDIRRGANRRRGLPLSFPALMGLLCLLFVGELRVPAASSTPAKVVPEEATILIRMAREGTNVALLYRLGEVCHSAGGTGDKEAVVRAEAYLRKLLSVESTNALATALLGSVYTMKGRDAFWPTTQLRLVREGNEFMDQSVRLAPEDPHVRLIRAINNAHMPDFLGRTAIVRADLAWLWEKAEKEPARFSADNRQELALHWGRQLQRQHRSGEARTVWERGRSIDADSRLARMLAEELAKLR